MVISKNMNTYKINDQISYWSPIYYAANTIKQNKTNGCIIEITSNGVYVLVLGTADNHNRLEYQKEYVKYTDIVSILTKEEIESSKHELEVYESSIVKKNPLPIYDPKRY